MLNKGILLITFGLVITGYSATFSQEEARRIFGEPSLRSLSFPSVVGDYLFLELSWKEDRLMTLEERESQELEVMLSAIEKFIETNICSYTNSPFCRTLTDWLIVKPNFSIPNVKSCVVKDTSTEGVHSQIVAVEAAPLLSIRELVVKKCQTQRRTKSEWVDSLKRVEALFKKENKEEKFYTLLGCPLVNLIYNFNGDNTVSSLQGCEKTCEELDLIVNFSKDYKSLFVKNSNIFGRQYSNSQNNLFLPRWIEDDEGRFVEAEKLYRQGKDIPKIINLLTESIAMNPIHSRKWEYLGGALRASGRTGVALIAYIQSLRINPKNSWAWKGLRSCCEKCGLIENAKGLSWYLLMRGIEKP